MNDNELDDLFRSNADYLADQPPRDFDNDAFWQQMQLAIPRKANRNKPRVWIWAAAVLLAGMFGGGWWIQVQEKGLKEQKMVQKASNAPSMKDSEPIAKVPQASTQPVPSKPSEIGIEKRTLLMPEKSVVPLHLPMPATEPVMVAIKEHSPAEVVVEVAKSLPETTAPIVHEKTHYRVVHINEIRERKQQEAKARTRMAFRIGLPSITPLTKQSDYEAPLSISIQN